MRRTVGDLKIALTAIATAVALAACGNGDSSTADTSAAATHSARLASPQSQAARGRAQADGSKVTIKDFEYVPADLEVAAGTEVTWTNEDFFGHTVTSGAPGKETGRFDGTLGEVADAEGTRFAYTFDEPGTYRYFCRFHPERMRAVVTVTP